MKGFLTYYSTYFTHNLIIPVVKNRQISKVKCVETFFTFQINLQSNKLNFQSWESLKIVHEVNAALP